MQRSELACDMLVCQVDGWANVGSGRMECQECGGSY